MEKLTYYPESLTACKELLAHYADYDLLKILDALKQSIKETDFDLLKANTKILSEKLDDIWNNKNIQRKNKGIKYGIPISLAALGAAAAGPVGAAGGFLAGLGYSVGETLLKIGKETLGEKAAKRLSKSHQVNIFDFKKKYQLK